LVEIGHAFLRGKEKWKEEKEGRRSKVANRGEERGRVGLEKPWVQLSKVKRKMKKRKRKETGKPTKRKWREKQKKNLWKAPIGNLQNYRLQRDHSEKEVGC